MIADELTKNNPGLVVQLWTSSVLFVYVSEDVRWRPIWFG